MILKFPNFARLAGISLAGFVLLAAGQSPEPALSPPPAAAAPLTADTAAFDAADETTAPAVAVIPPASLAKLVADVAALPAAPLDADLRCLATAVFFEARGEPLAGQLAVAQVILNRVASGKYANDICGVVYQPRQFSFARRVPDTTSADWRIARAVATIAQAEGWLQVAPRAMSFHASYVAPAWNRERVGRVGNHVFYR